MFVLNITGKPENGFIAAAFKVIRVDFCYRMLYIGGMLSRRNWKALNVICIILLTCSCKKAFTPSLSASDSGSYLVIEGTISGAADSTIIKLSRTKKVDTLKTIIPELNATLTVESDANSIYPLSPTAIAGTYACTPIYLDPAHKYRLRIKTADSKEYLSDFVAVKNAPPIDSVGFVAQTDGVHIYVNTHDDANATKYYRWDYSEGWQFHSKYVSGYYSSGSKLFARPSSQQVYNCFGNDVSDNVIIASTTKLTNDIIYQAPLTLIPANSEKIETKYSILVKQYALTSDAYSFWDNLQKNTEKLGSIFDVLPSQAPTNFHCLTNPSELVIGYLSVGNASSKRIFITAGQLLSTYSPLYPCACKLDTAFDNPDPKILTQKQTNILVPANSPYIPVTGLFIPPDNPFGGPNAYTFSTILCVDCTVRGSRTAPPYWK